MSNYTMSSPPLLEVRNVFHTYDSQRIAPTWLKASSAEPAWTLKNINFSLQAGQNLGIVGESGSGKTTLAKLIMALATPSHGSIYFKGQNLHTLPPPALRTLRSGFQMVFQDPYGSLDPRQRINQIITEPLHQLHLSQAELTQRATQALQAVGLPESALDRLPHEFSGGQRQRIAIARAIISQPSLVVADEPVSALDTGTQVQVLDTLQTLQQKGISLLLISHDLAVVEHLCKQLCVLYQGQIVEQGSTAQILQNPQHPYTRQLLDAARL